MTVVVRTCAALRAARGHGLAAEGRRRAVRATRRWRTGRSGLCEPQGKGDGTRDRRRQGFRAHAARAPWAGARRSDTIARGAPCKSAVPKFRMALQIHAKRIEFHMNSCERNRTRGVHQALPCRARAMNAAHRTGRTDLDPAPWEIRGRRLAMHERVIPLQATLIYT
jgi:hypothetical protein